MWPKVVGGKNAACGPHVFSGVYSKHEEFLNSRWNPGFQYKLPKRSHVYDSEPVMGLVPEKIHHPPLSSSQSLKPATQFSSFSLLLIEYLEIHKKSSAHTLLFATPNLVLSAFALVPSSLYSSPVLFSSISLPHTSPYPIPQKEKLDILARPHWLNFCWGLIPKK